jgi:catechol 2,3-dioxygenase-like lactoylglutathione lyase family enzyme
VLASCDPIICVATTDAGRAQVFYRDVLGLPLIEENPFASVFRANRVILRVSVVGELSPAPYTVLGWSVEDIEGMVKHLGERGVAFERFSFPGMDQNGLGIWTAPSGDRVAWFKDPDENLLSLTQGA